MAESKSSSGGVEHRVDSDGNHHVGVEHEGVFVPFATRDAVDFADRVEAGKSPEAQAAAAPASEEGGE